MTNIILILGNSNPEILNKRLDRGIQEFYKLYYEHIFVNKKTRLLINTDNLIQAKDFDKFTLENSTLITNLIKN